MRTMKRLSVSVCAVALMGLMGCQDANRENQPANGVVDMENQTDNEMMRDGDMTRQSLSENDQSLYDLASENNDLTSFSQNLNSPEASETLDRGAGPYTVFAPDNAAYDELSDQDRNDANANLVASLEYLVIEDELTQQELRSQVENSDGEYTLTTLQGGEITVDLQGEDIILRDVMGNEATIVSSDDDAFNGIVHVIDGVLRPNTEGGQNNNQMTQRTTSVVNPEKAGTTTVAVDK